jgi:outer membrane lipoprotein SlyB
MSVTRIVSIALLAVVAVGCSSFSGSSYERREARKEMSVRMGVVEGTRQVSLEGTKSGVGAVAGGAVGGIAGSNIGGGKGSTVGAILGAVAGGVAGAAAEGAFTKKDGVEVTVKLDNGQLVAITQESEDGVWFRPGDRVRIVSDGRTSRVTY